jgi:hypothetical protein
MLASLHVIGAKTARRYSASQPGFTRYKVMEWTHPAVHPTWLGPLWQGKQDMLSILGGSTMQQVATLGIDAAKNLFQLHGVDVHGKVVLKKRLARHKGI